MNAALLRFLRIGIAYGLAAVVTAWTNNLAVLPIPPVLQPLILPILTAGFAALGKWIRDYFSDVPLARFTP